MAELTVISVKSLDRGFYYLIYYYSIFAVAEVGVSPKAIGFETLHFAENITFSPPDSRRSYYGTWQ